MTIHVCRDGVVVENPYVVYLTSVQMVNLIKLSNFNSL
jgi:hypothetical protein